MFYFICICKNRRNCGECCRCVSDLCSQVRYSLSQLISRCSHTQPCMTGPLKGQLVNRGLLVLPEQLG